MNKKEDNFEDSLKILNHLERDPHTTQRELVKNTEMSLGKINFLLQALVAKGIVKIQRFKNSKNKKAYAYVLTPKGFREKTLLTQEFLRIKMKEFDKLKREIEKLQHEQAQNKEECHAE